ncbi:MAG: hypothetical protein Q8O88_03795 [bacterium]|nr:hypothetical protein [bacterium]
MAKKKQTEPTERIIIPEDDFFSVYKPLINHIVRANTDHNIANEEIASYNGSLYETYGEELAHIVALANNQKTRNRVWTLVDGDDDKQYIIAGYHLVNRQGYFITQKSWVVGTEEVILDNTIDG